MQLKPIYTRAGEVEAAEGPRHAEMLEKNGYTKAACLTDAQLPLFRQGYRTGWREGRREEGGSTHAKA